MPWGATPRGPGRRPPRSLRCRNVDRSRVGRFHERRLKGVPEPIRVFRLLDTLAPLPQLGPLPPTDGNEGRKLRGLGDALLAAFDSPTDAVLCAMAMQDRLAAWNSKAQAGERIEIRIAISQGEVRRSRGDLHGEAVQLALEAEARAEAGEVLLTDAVYLSMNKTEAATEVVGEVLLHGSGRTRLRRAVRGADPRAPYGGRALARLGRLSNPAPARPAGEADRTAP